MENETELMRKVYARLLEDKKYTASHEMDKYGFAIIKYSNKSYGERNPNTRDAIIIIITALISIASTLIATLLVSRWHI